MPNVKVFPCPQCGEFVATDASRCRFCLTSINPQTAQLAVAAQAKENKRYMRSRYLRHVWIGAGVFALGTVLAGGMVILLFQSEVPPLPRALTYYFMVTLGLVFYGAGDFLYGAAGVLGMIK